MGARKQRSKPWTNEEIEYLKNHYPTTKPKDMVNYFNRTKGAIKVKATQLGIKSLRTATRTYSFDENFFGQINEQVAFYAGFTSADGCVHKNKNLWGYSLQLATKDLFFLEQFRKDCKSTHPIKTEYYENKNNKSINGIIMKPTWRSRFSIYSCLQWKLDLERIWGVCENKTFRISPPNIVGKNMECSFILGFLMGDGCIHVRENKGKPYITICATSSSEKILIYIKEIFEKYFPYIYHNNVNSGIKSTKTKCLQYAIGGVRAAVIIDYLIKLKCPKFDRKLNNNKLNSALNYYKTIYPEYFLDNNPYSISHPQAPSVLCDNDNNITLCQF